ncbi:Retrovirus-related Pol polyprotein from transposon RE1 [Vitis vinifera]|uniref:Retrovirus-related Pol polyprotein from transposon RE1 n=1 Tax=Vitis vinifera TaxID=29760 RepID=A0A438DXV1_VITVI|nr:Retrovirus-related Pol polyprotein from transposon RE1 [Vitis vinifera]
MVDASSTIPSHLPLSTNTLIAINAFDALLFGYDLLGYIDGTKPCPSSKIIINGKQISNLDYIFWTRQDKLLLLRIIGSLSHKVVPVVHSCKTSVKAWHRLAKLYANPSSSRTIGLAKQLTLLNRGSQPVIDYLATIRDIVDEPNLLGVPIPNQYLITHTLNGVDPEFKEIVVVVQAWDTMITFDELHDKLVEYEAFLKREELCSTGNLAITTNNSSTNWLLDTGQPFKGLDGIVISDDRGSSHKGTHCSRMEQE